MIFNDALAAPYVIVLFRSQMTTYVRQSPKVTVAKGS